MSGKKKRERSKLTRQVQVGLICSTKFERPLVERMPCPLGELHVAKHLQSVRLGSDQRGEYLRRSRSGATDALQKGSDF